MSHEPDLQEPEADELSSLFRTMRDDRAPDDLEEKLLTAVAVGGAAWAVKTGFFATLFAKLFAATKGSAAATVLGVSLAAAGSLAAVHVIATQTAPRQAIEPSRRAAPVVVQQAAPAPRPEPAPTSEIAPALVPTVAPSAVPATPGPRASTPLREVVPRSEPTSKDTDAPPPPATVAIIEPPAPPPADVLREEANKVRGVADLVAAGRCAEASGAIQAYRASFPRGQLAREITLLEARCASPK